MRMLRAHLVDVAFESSREAVNDFRGIKTRGVEHTFEARDRNFPSRNGWQFAIFVPREWRKGTYVSVRPLSTPNRKIWAGLERRSVQFAPCTKLRHRSKCYGTVSVSDPSGTKTRVILRRTDPIPPWLEAFRLTEKERVATSRANDGRTLVAVLGRDDFAGMVRLFVACRAWTLTEGYSRDDAALARRIARERALRARRSLNGLTVSVTGFLGMGTRAEVERLLKKHGATFRGMPSADTDLLIEGYHGLGEDRRKVRAAKQLAIPRMTEARFRRKFAV